MTLSEFREMLLQACHTRDFTPLDGFLELHNPTLEELQNFSKEIFTLLRTIDSKDSVYQRISAFARILIEEIKKVPSPEETSASAPRENSTSLAESEDISFQRDTFEQSSNDLVARFEMTSLKKQTEGIEKIDSSQLEKNSDSDLEEEESPKKDKRKKSRLNKKDRKKKTTAPKKETPKKDSEPKSKKIMGYLNFHSFQNIASPVSTAALSRESWHYQKIAKDKLYFQEEFSIPKDLIELSEDEKSDIEDSTFETNESDLQQNASQPFSTQEAAQETTSNPSNPSFDLSHLTFAEFKTPIEPSSLTFIQHEEAVVNVSTPEEISNTVELQSLPNLQVTESQSAQVNSELARPIQSIRVSMQVSDTYQRKNLPALQPIQLDLELLQWRQKMDEIERGMIEFYATRDTSIDTVIKLHDKSVELTTDLGRTSHEYEHPNKPAIQNFQHAMISLRSFSRRMGIERLLLRMSTRTLQRAAIARRFEDERSTVRKLLRAGTVALKKALNIAARRIDEAQDASEIPDVDELLKTTPPSPGQPPHTNFAAKTLSYFAFLYRETLSDELTPIASITQGEIRDVEIKYNRLKAGVR